MEPKFQTEKRAYTATYVDAAGREIRLRGELTVPHGEGRFPAVILSHGFNGYYRDFPVECRRWAGQGYVCCAFDFCGAQSGGASTGRTAAEYTPLTMVEDLKAVIADVRGLDIVDESRIFLFGGSQGGLVTALTAAEEDVRDGLAAIALYFPALNIPNDWRTAPIRETRLMGYSIGEAYIRSVRELDPYEVIGGFEKDVSIVWGDEDPIVTGTTVEAAVAAYGPERVALTIIPGAGHGFIGEALDTAVETVLAFFEAHR